MSNKLLLETLAYFFPFPSNLRQPSWLSSPSSSWLFKAFKNISSIVVNTDSPTINDNTTLYAETQLFFPTPIAAHIPPLTKAVFFNLRSAGRFEISFEDSLHLSNLDTFLTTKTYRLTDCTFCTLTKKDSMNEIGWEALCRTWETSCLSLLSKW